MSRSKDVSEWSELLSEIDEKISTSVTSSEGKPEQKSALFTYLGKAYMLDVLYQFASDTGSWRFNELREQLDIPPTTLTNRLKDLTDAGLVVRESYDEIPPRVEYTATRKLLDLRPVFGCLGLWVAKHDWDGARSDTLE